MQAAATEAAEGLGGTSVYLVGMMGSGKSTVGKMLAQALGYCCFDTDALIEQAAGKTIPEIFAEDGEAEFRALETQVLQELAPFRDCVISTGGGAACTGVNWGHMHGGISVWLNAPPALLARRVVRDGTANRPLLADNSSIESSGSAEVAGDEEEYVRTVAKLAKLLEQRREQYGYADITVSLEGEGEDAAAADLGAPAAVVVHRVLAAVADRIKRDAAARAERGNFEVTNDALPPTMRVVSNINTVGDGGEADPFLP